MRVYRQSEHEAVSLSSTSRDGRKSVYVYLVWKRFGRAGCIPLHRQQYRGAGCILLHLHTILLNARMPDGTASGQSGTVMNKNANAESSPVSVYRVTGLRCMVPECRCRRSIGLDAAA